MAIEVTELDVGRRVVHRVRRDGVIAVDIGSGEGGRVRVRFDDDGFNWLVSKEDLEWARPVDLAQLQKQIVPRAVRAAAKTMKIVPTWTDPQWPGHVFSVATGGGCINCRATKNQVLDHDVPTPCRGSLWRALGM